MTNKTDFNQPSEGYVYTSYGKLKYLRDVIVSVETLRRYDQNRPVALLCSKEHSEEIKRLGLNDYFGEVGELSPEHQSIVGFKHNLHLYMPFDRNMYLDSDMIWCRNPDKLWHDFAPYPYTITGQESADVFYGAPKNIGVMMDILLRRRQKTLKKFGLSHLYRVQTGIMYAADPGITEKVDRLAAGYLSKKDQTHFVSRTNEAGRSLESCEWSLGMAMSELKLFVYPWFNGYESPQLDFIDGLTKYDNDFRNVSCKYYCNPFMHGLRGIQPSKFRNFIKSLFFFLPRSDDHFWCTPYILHFGWSHQKSFFNAFAEREWERFKKEKVKFLS